MATVPASQPIWLGTPKAAKYLGVNLRMLYKLIDTGQIPAYRMGRVMRVRIADLDAFLAATQIEPGTLGHLHAGRPAPPSGKATAKKVATRKRRSRRDGRGAAVGRVPIAGFAWMMSLDGRAAPRSALGVAVETSRYHYFAVRLGADGGRAK